MAKAEFTQKDYPDNDTTIKLGGDAWQTPKIIPLGTTVSNLGSGAMLGTQIVQDVYDVYPGDHDLLR